MTYKPFTHLPFALELAVDVAFSCPSPRDILGRVDIQTYASHKVDNQPCYLDLIISNTNNSSSKNSSIGRSDLLKDTKWKTEYNIKKDTIPSPTKNSEYIW